MMPERGYIQVYTGNGKGKTTAAFGLALRASGHGIKSLIIQFMKGNENYGEILAVSRIPEITVFQFGGADFVRKGKEKENDYEEARKALKKVEESFGDPEISILILDEINVAMFFNLIKTEEVLSLLDKKPPHLEVILTGRGAPEEIIARADLVTRMEEVKHYYNTIKLPARKGIEH